jgi:hypothetical protein
LLSRVSPVAGEVTFTVAPVTPDPDLSFTLPEKLPVACPNADNAPVSANAKVSTETRNLGRITAASFTAGFGHPASSIVRFMANPLSKTQLMLRLG